jgi:hypothetical protein
LSTGPGSTSAEAFVVVVVFVDASVDVASTTGVKICEITAMEMVDVGVVDVVAAKDGTDVVASGKGADDDDTCWRTPVMVLTVVLGVGEVVSSTST